MSRRRKRASGYHPGDNRRAVHLGDVTTPDTSNIRMIRTGEEIEIGDLSGAARAPVTARFWYFGTRLRVNPGLTELDVVDLLEQANNVKMDDPNSMTMTKDYVRAHIHPEDFDAFWKLVKANHQDTTDIMTLCWKLLDAITANPTGERQDSSGGPLVTKTSSPSTPPASVTDLGEHRARREAYMRQIEALEAKRGEDGQPVPVNAAIALQIIEHAKTQGIDLVSGSRLANATG